MRIVFQGKLPEPIMFNGKCPYCNTIVELEEKECSCEGDRHAHHGEARYYIKCPTPDCPRDITLEKGKYVAYL